MTGPTISRCWSGICRLPLLLPLGLVARLAALERGQLHQHRVRPEELVCRLLLEKKMPRALAPVAASARITGRYSRRAPAITAFTATFSTVYSLYSLNYVGRMWPTSSSAF